MILYYTEKSNYLQKKIDEILEQEIRSSLGSSKLRQW